METYPFPVGELLSGLLIVTVKSHFFSHISDNLCASEAKKSANVMFFETNLHKLHITLNTLRMGDANLHFYITTAQDR